MQVVAVGEGMSVIGLRARASPQDGGWWGEEWMSDRAPRIYRDLKKAQSAIPWNFRLLKHNYMEEVRAISAIPR